MEHYILNGKEPVKCDLMTWAAWFENANRTVAKTVIDPRVDDRCEVSTVFLGIDHNFGNGLPILFETLVFGGPRDGEMDRYATWDEAETGHKKTVEEIKAMREGTNVREFPKTANRPS